MAGNWVQSNIWMLILGGCVLAVLARIWIDRLDRSRIRSYIGQRGGTVSRIWWSPFGRGWYGTRQDRIYRVRYFDAHGDEHAAYCKTKMLSGVYFTDDNVVAGEAMTCPSCGYNLRGNLSGVCPECGVPTPARRKLETTQRSG